MNLKISKKFYKDLTKINDFKLLQFIEDLLIDGKNLNFIEFSKNILLRKLCDMISFIE